MKAVRPSVRFIAETVAETFDVPYLRIISGGMAVRVVAARQVTAWLAYRHTDLSHEEIARLLGRKVEAVGDAIERVDERRGADAGFAHEAGVAEDALLTAAAALRRMTADAPDDPDPFEVAERILSGRAVEVPSDALRALAAAALAQPNVPAGTTNPALVADLVTAGRQLLAALDRCNTADRGTVTYGRAAVIRTSAVHTFREALRRLPSDSHLSEGDSHAAHG